MGGYGLVAIDPAAVEVGAPPPVRLAAPPDVPFLRPGAHQRTLVSGTDDEGEPGRDPWHAAVQRAQRSLLAEEDENDEEADDHDDRPASLPPSRQTDHGSPSRPRVVGPTPPPLSPFAGVESAHDTSDRARWVRSAGSLDIPDTTPYPLPAADGSRITQPWDAPARPLRRVTNPYVELPGPHHIRRTVVDSLEAEDSVRPGGVPPAERYCFRGPFLREDAELALVRATEVGDVLAILQRYTQQFFERTVLLVVTQSCAVVRQWHNVQLEITTRFSLDAPSSLQRAADGGEPLIAELGAIGVDALFRRSIGGSPGRVGLVPVCLRGRCVALVYGDDGESVDPGAVAQVSSFAASCGASIARVIVAHKRPGG